MFKGSGLSNKKLIGGDKKGAHDPNREPLVSFYGQGSPAGGPYKVRQAWIVS